MSLTTLHDRITVRPIQPTLSTEIEGFEVVGESKKSATEGIVVGVGQGRMMGSTLVPLLVKPGDHVLYQGAHPIEVDIDGEELLVMSEGEVLAVLEPD
jgi:chaperonin GroES